MSIVRIGLMGLPFDSKNNGCKALAYSFLEMLNIIAKSKSIKIDVCVIVDPGRKQTLKSFASNKMKKILYEKNIPRYKYDNLNYKIAICSTFGRWVYLSDEVKQNDLIFDFTEGDSFTDLYGEKRFYRKTAIKEKIEKSNVKLVIGSQTIGPFSNKNIREIAASVIAKAWCVFVRDKLSYNYVREICNINPILTTDVAFFLPYKKSNSITKDLPRKIGVNVSGLLWTNENKLNLSVDYKKYCYAIIEYLLNEKYEVVCIPHVYDDDVNNLDNDKIPMLELKKAFPAMQMFETVDNPIDIKTKIGTMDLFIGSRMHATIAAFSAGVPVIPFSYSRKFEGLFGSLDYFYTINGGKLTTEEAIEMTVAYIKEYDVIKEKLSKTSLILEKKKSEMLQLYSDIIMREIDKKDEK